MAGQVQCKTCGFDLGALSATLRVTPAEGPVRNLSCPMCGYPVTLDLAAHGVLVRGSGQGVTFSRWKVSSRDPSGNVVIAGSRLRLKIEGLRSIEPREICYPRVPVFWGEDGQLQYPVLPIRPEYFDCVDEGRLFRSLDQGLIGEAIGSQFQLTLPLRALDEPVKLLLPLHTPEPGPPGSDNAFGELNLRIWPNINVRQWKYYLVGLAGTGPKGDRLVLEGRIRARVMVLGTGGAVEWQCIEGKQRGGASRVSALDQRPTWVSLEISDSSGVLLAGGLFHAPPAHSDAVGDVRMGVDFGTSNTCAAMGGSMTLRQEKPELLPGVDERRWNLYLLRGGPEAAAPQGPDLWPPCKGFGLRGDLLPTELLFPRRRADMAASLASIGAWQFGLDFGIPGAGIKPEYSEAEYTLGDFKWSDLLRGSAPLFTQHTSALQSQYLSAFLMLAYVRMAVASERAAVDVNVTFSYPMAFSDGDRKTLGEGTTQAEGILKGQTGLSWNVRLGVDESTAAARNVGETSANIHVYMDMGGGSTDVGIRLETAAGKFRTIYLTSVAYAGSALLAGFAGKLDERTGKYFNSCLAGRTTLDVLRRRVRESRSAKDVLGDPSLFSKTLERVAANRIRHFYAYATEYVARLLAAGLLDQRFRVKDGQDWVFPPEVKFAFFFLGNGWGFASPASGEVTAVLAEAVFSRAIQLVRAEKTQYGREVRSGLKGRPISSQVGKLRDVPHSKAAVALGLLKGGETNQGVAGSPAGIVGWTTKVGDREVPWFAYYTHRDSGGPFPPEGFGGSAGSAALGGGAVFLGDDDEEEEASDKALAWYETIPTTARMDWQDSAPSMPEGFDGPFEHDPDLNATRGVLRAKCSVRDTGWFARGAFEVMLEALFKPKLPEIV